MTRGRWIAALLALLLIGGAAGWWFGSPWYTLHRMREAARARDLGALSRYIDHDALFRDMTRQMERRRGRGFRGYARALVTLMPRHERLLALFDPEASDRSYGMRFDELELRRDSLEQFRLVRRAGGELVFHRDGLGWRLVGLHLAEDMPALSQGADIAAEISDKCGGPPGVARIDPLSGATDKPTLMVESAELKHRPDLLRCLQDLAATAGYLVAVQACESRECVEGQVE